MGLWWSSFTVDPSFKSSLDMIFVPGQNWTVLHGSSMQNSKGKKKKKIVPCFCCCYHVGNVIHIFFSFSFLLPGGRGKNWCTKRQGQNTFFSKAYPFIIIFCVWTQNASCIYILTLILVQPNFVLHFLKCHLTAFLLCIYIGTTY